jgi:Ni,Fe-hydrogenase III large subunit
MNYFECELYEQTGIEPERHPWLRPVRAAYAWRRDGMPFSFYRVDGEEVHEVAVGPVHAGVIEPGHFRFQCHGEHVQHLEIALGFQHRGIEHALLGGPGPRTPHLIETLAGDTTAGHATAYAQTIEALTGVTPPPRAEAIRILALELERLANHTGDLGALANDVGYLPTASYCGRLRGDFLNLTALLCGNRFGRGLVIPGGVAFDLEPAHLVTLRERLEMTFCDVRSAVECLWRTPTVLSRFEGTGPLPAQTCVDLGIVGVPARASGLTCDVRNDFPSGGYRPPRFPVSTAASGDVHARAYVRWLEIQASVAFIRDQLDQLPPGPLAVPVGNERTPRAIAVSLVEGWRGEIVHVALTDAAGRFSRYKVIDPSFHNWIGLAMAMRNQAISDFPLCNKSFNLSYCGHDL